jgi:hypothetical protein
MTFLLDLTHKKEDYTHYPKKASKALYFLYLLVLTVCDFMIFLFLVPLIMFIDSILLLIVFSTLGLIFGLLYSFLIKDIEHLEPKHHLFAAFYIPVLSILNILILLNVGNALKGKYTFSGEYMFFASFLYVIMFLLPYTYETFFHPVLARMARQAKHKVQKH